MELTANKFGITSEYFWLRLNSYVLLYPTVFVWLLLIVPRIGDIRDDAPNGGYYSERINFFAELTAKIIPRAYQNRKTRGISEQLQPLTI